MYKFIYFCLFSCLCAVPLQAQEFDVKKAVQEKLAEPNINEMLSSSFDVGDVNNDGYISENEFGYLLKGVDMDLSLQEDEKTQKKSRLQEYFKQFDQDSDLRLSKEEYLNLLQKETEYETQERIKKVQEMSAKSPEAMMRDFNEKMEKAKAAMDKLNNMSTEELSNKFLDNISNNIAGENYFQMDKDKDGCVTADEYAEYMVVFSKNVAENNKDTMSDMPEADWRELYKDEKKAKDNCLTKEEYIRNFNEMANVSDMEDCCSADK